QAVEQRRADAQETARLNKVQGSVADVSVSSVEHANGSATTVDRSSGRDFGQVSAHARQATATYKVAKGDTLSSIAKRHSVEVAKLREWNHLKNDQIRLGQVLRIDNN
ncbi:LysM peptidoglycan-binding domain-containing protein, partial [Rhodanobacter denitrificans]